MLPTYNNVDALAIINALCSRFRIVLNIAKTEKLTWNILDDLPILYSRRHRESLVLCSTIETVAVASCVWYCDGGTKGN